MNRSFLSGCILTILFCSYVQTNSNIFSESRQDDLLTPESRENLNAFDSLDFGKFYNDMNAHKHDNKTCHTCKDVMTLAKLVIKDPAFIREIGKSVCSKGMFATERECSGLFDRMADPLVFIFQNTTLTVPEFCGVLFHPECMVHLGLPISQKINWELPLPKRKPFNPLIKDGDKLKMLHLTDIHLDLWYTPGANSLCNEGVCCRSTTFGNNHSAGYWSESRYSCDCPPVFLNNTIDKIGKTHSDIDLVLWTGDNIPHDVWNTTIPINLLHNKVVADQIRNAFKGKLVFPSVGNHETHPINMYIPNEVSVLTNGSYSNNWLYDTLADDYWAEWINTEEAKKTFKKGGYYSAQAKPGLKIIVLNSNIAQDENYWIAYNPYDPDGQIQWLIDELDKAETNGEYVIISGHMPPPSTYLAWVNNYIRIVERYAHLIAGTYWGHTHNDEILVFYNKDKNNQTYPVSHSYIGSSLSTYPSLNPGYRIFTLDSNGIVLDFETYFTNATDDDIKGPNVEPKWSVAYSAKQSYGLDDLSTKSWDKFINAAKTDDKLTESYFEHYSRFSEAYEEQLENSHNLNIDYKRNLLQNRKYINPIYELE